MIDVIFVIHGCNHKPNNKACERQTPFGAHRSNSGSMREGFPLPVDLFVVAAWALDH